MNDDKNKKKAVEVLGDEESTIVSVDDTHRPILYDLDGNDALSQTGENLRYQVQRFSTAALPALLNKALRIALKSKNDRNALEAMKFIKELSSGKFSEKAIEGRVKKLTDDEILKELEGKQE